LILLSPKRGIFPPALSLRDEGGEKFRNQSGILGREAAASLRTQDSIGSLAKNAQSGEPQGISERQIEWNVDLAFFHRQNFMVKADSYDCRPKATIVPRYRAGFALSQIK
jgi:hypothetical protein